MDLVYLHIYFLLNAIYPPYVCNFWYTLVGMCHGSVAERWLCKAEALGSIPGSATFLSFAVSKVFGQ